MSWLRPFLFRVLPGAILPLAPLAAQQPTTAGAPWACADTSVSRWVVADTAVHRSEVEARERLEHSLART